MSYIGDKGTPITSTEAGALANLTALSGGTGLFIRKTGATTFENASEAEMGTVTNVSIVSANGLAGTVATPGTTPAITLSTSITGLLKGNGTAISAASDGTDFLSSTTGLKLDQTTPQTITGGSPIIPSINGSAADNGDITINGTSSATKTTSYVILQATGGLVGVGTTAPARQFEVVGGALGTETILAQLRSGFTEANTATTLRFVNSTTGASASMAEISSRRTAGSGSVLTLRTSTDAGAVNNSVIINEVNNVGIGGTPYFKLDVAGNIRIQGSSLLYFGGSTSGSDWNTRIGLSGTDFSFSSGRFVWTNGGYAYSTTTWMNLASSGTAAYIGNLGLGTLTPTYKVDIKANGYVVYGTTFTGTGVNNAYGSGIYTGTDATAPTYTVVIDATGTPDTFKWKKNDGAYTTGVAITASAIALSDGVSVAFGTTTGHTLNDQWVVTVQLSDPLGVQNTAGTRLMVVTNTGYVGIGTTDFDGTPAIGRLVVKGSTNDGSTNILVGRDSDEANVFSVNTNGQILSDSLTASEILITDASKNIVSAAVATYPSLTELAYLKGVTSGIQGQFSDKAATSQTFYIGTTQVAINRASAALTLAGITLTTPDIGTPSAGTLTNCTGYANDINLPKGKQINLTLPDTDATATGNVSSSWAAGYSSAVGDLVFFGSGGKWLEVDADAVATCQGLLGIALEAKTDGQAMKVALPGSMVHLDAWAWTVGATLYAGETLGLPQEAIPTGADAIIRVIGFAVDADTIYFNPSSDQQSTVA